MPVEKKIINYSIENIKAGVRNENNFDFFRFEYFAKDIEHLSKSHRHEFHALIFVTGGTGSHVVDFVEYPLCANRCFYIGYGQIHAWKTLKHVKGYILLFTDDFYNAIYTGNKLIKSDRLFSELNISNEIPIEKSQEWIVFFNQIEQEFTAKELDWQLTICLLLKTIVLRLRRFNKKDNGIDEKVKKRLVMTSQYKELINENFIKLKSPKDYAEKLNITPNYLNGVCKEASGKSAGQLIKERVVLEAKRLIIHTQLTISQIAYRLGFEDKSHFGKYFKKFTGISPDKFRQDFLINENIKSKK
jgi:AraC family transcriptional activator of pobA